MLDPSKPDPDPDILIFKSGYPDPYPPDITIFRRISDIRISENPRSGSTYLKIVRIPDPSQAYFAGSDVVLAVKEFFTSGGMLRELKQQQSFLYQNLRGLMY
ncbi:hypothetical protein DY000_02033531 [Brassica cretica]|uniref:Uncharacterized protein n=1 Tax=Brassica cretica TaxID=69181 RepID=A0ABQ7DYP3_BRACR|nr:hypothetical protein DY000_02033531 [Brassica cretica]